MKNILSVILKIKKAFYSCFPKLLKQNDPFGFIPKGIPCYPKRVKRRLFIGGVKDSIEIQITETDKDCCEIKFSATTMMQDSPTVKYRIISASYYVPNIEDCLKVIPWALDSFRTKNIWPAFDTSLLEHLEKV
jgi:hypothetical protein